MKKDLEYYKNNAEEDYAQVPISVLRYISELEEERKQGQTLPIDSVVVPKWTLPCKECSGNGGGVTDNGWEICDCQK